MDWLYIHDEAILFYFQALQRPWLTPLMKTFTFIGDKQAMTVVALALAGLFAWTGRPRTTTCLVGSCLLALGILVSIKYFVHRTRPDMAWRSMEVPKSPSFPSGHSFMSMAVVGGAGMLAARDLRRRWARVLLLVGCFGFALWVGVSRLYLGVHYPVDVLTGWSGGLACAFLGVWADQRWGYQPPEAAAAPVLERAQEGFVSSNQGARTS